MVAKLVNILRKTNFFQKKTPKDTLFFILFLNFAPKQKHSYKKTNAYEKTP
jgi:hypothetical protein